MKRKLLLCLKVFLAEANLLAQPARHFPEFAGKINADCGTNSTLNTSGTTIRSEARVFPTGFFANQWEKRTLKILTEVSHGYNRLCGCIGIAELYHANTFTAGKSFHQTLQLLK